MASLINRAADDVSEKNPTIINGQVLFDTKTKYMYLDINGIRYEVMSPGEAGWVLNEEGTVTSTKQIVKIGEINDLVKTINRLNSDIGTLENDFNLELLGIETTLKNFDNNKANKATTLEGYGIDNAYTKFETDGQLYTKLDKDEVATTATAGKLLKLDSKAQFPASVLPDTIPIEKLPQGALERCIIVENDDARFALTDKDVQIGDTVKVIDSDIMYFVKDDTKLSSEDGYMIYTAGSATSVPWSGVEQRPDTLNGYGITDAVSFNEFNSFAGAVSDHMTQYEGMVVGLQSSKADKSSTLEGYGITDAYPKSLIDLYLSTINDNIEELTDNVDQISSNIDIHKLVYEQKVNDLENNKANKANTLEGYGIIDAYTKTETDDSIESLNDKIINLKFSDLKENPTTLTGYGITDAYTKEETDNKVANIQNEITKFQDTFTIKEDGSVETSSLQIQTSLTLNTSNLKVQSGSYGIVFKINERGSLITGQNNYWYLENGDKINNTISETNFFYFINGYNHRIFQPEDTTTGLNNFIVMGRDNNLKNTGATLIGQNLQSSKTNQVVLGNYNKDNDKAIFIIGSGTASERKNVFEVLNNGIKIGDTTLTEAQLKTLLASLPATLEEEEF